MKAVKMTDHKPYVELKEKYDKLQAELRPLIIGESPDALRARAKAEELSIEAEAEALLDPKAEAAAKKAQQKAKELLEEAENRERRILILRTAIAKLEPDLRKVEEEAALKVIASVRPKHETVVSKIIDLQRQLNAALQEEQEICQYLRGEVGSDAAIVPVYQMLGSKNKWGKVQPGSEGDQNSEFYRILTRLRERGYRV